MNGLHQNRYGNARKEIEAAARRDANAPLEELRQSSFEKEVADRLEAYLEFVKRHKDLHRREWLPGVHVTLDLSEFRRVS